MWTNLSSFSLLSYICHGVEAAFFWALIQLIPSPLHPGIFVFSSKIFSNKYPRAGREKARGGWPYFFSWNDVYDAYFGWCSIAFIPVHDLRDDVKISFLIYMIQGIIRIYYTVMEIRDKSLTRSVGVAQVGG